MKLIWSREFITNRADPNFNLQSGKPLHPFFELPFLAVSGLGRSGTTVLRNCVAAHPEIETLNRESNYLFSLMRGANLASEDQSLVKNLVLDRSSFWNLHRQMVLDLCWPEDRIKNRETTKAISTYTRLDPRAAMGLTESFSQATVLYTIRNGIEVVSSFQSFEAFQHLSFEQACTIWNSQLLMFQYCRDNPHAFLIRYEWLLEDRARWEEVFDQCLKHVGLDLHPSCLKPLGKRFHPTRYSGENSRDSKDMHQRKNRWRLWTNEQKTCFIDQCGATMDELGYEIPFR